MSTATPGPAPWILWRLQRGTCFSIRRGGGRNSAKAPAWRALFNQTFVCSSKKSSSGGGTFIVLCFLLEDRHCCDMLLEHMRSIERAFLVFHLLLQHRSRHQSLLRAVQRYDIALLRGEGGIQVLIGVFRLRMRRCARLARPQACSSVPVWLV